MVRIIGPRGSGRRFVVFGAILSTLALLGLIVIPAAQGLTQSDFELDKNATNDLSTTHLAILNSNVNSTALTIVVCQFGTTNPTSGTTIMIDAEQMTVGSPVTNASGGGCPTGTVKRNYPVTRHVNGTTAASHSGGADVTAMVTGSVTGIDADQVWDRVVNHNDKKCTTLGAVACDYVHDGFGVSVFTTGGSKDDLNINPGPGEAGTGWRWTDSSVPDADEILDAFAVKFDHTSTGGDQLLYFGADRYATNGAKDFGFWFFHQPVGTNPDGTFSGNHTAPSTGQSGDILILGTFTQGGAATNIRIFEWVGTGGNTNNTLNTAGAFGDCVPSIVSDKGCNTVNNTTVPSPWAYVGKGGAAANVFYSGAYMEGGVDLTALGLQGCFSSFMAETRSSPEVGAQLKDFALGSFEACGSTLTTTPSDSAGTALTDTDANGLVDAQLGTADAGVDVTDSADLEVSGTSSFNGTLDFYLCGPIDDPTTCDTGGVLIDSQSVSANGTFTSAAAHLTSAGRYCWRGEFTSSTQGVPDATDDSTGECFEVLPVQPSLDTQAVDANGADQTDAVPFGDPVYDKGSLSGTAFEPGTDGGSDPGQPDNTYPSINATMTVPAGGSISFDLKGPDGATTECSADATGTGSNPESVDVSGDGDYFTTGFTPDLPGVYHWVASYDGDSPNTLSADHNTACDDTKEDVTVQQLQPTMDTAQNFVPNDSATVSVDGGAGDLDGTVTFYLWVNDATCGGGDLGTADFTSTPVTVSATDTGAGTTLSDDASSDNSTAYDTNGTTFSWVVVFESNNSAHLDVTSGCGNETSSIAIDNGVSQPV